MKLAVLGPKGTFTELAALKYRRDANIIYGKGIYKTLLSVKEGKADEAVVPIENLLEGTIRETLDSLPKLDLKILAEFDMPIHHCLAKHRDTLEIKIIMSYTNAIKQCSNYLHEHYDNTELKEADSTGEAMRLVAEKEIPDSAAIGLRYAAEFYGLELIALNIEDNHDNLTRFVVVGKNGSNKNGTKTSIVITPYKDYAGLLYKLTSEFANRRINLCKIESRPTEKKLGEYMFYLDFDGDKNDEIIKEVLEVTKQYGDVKLLGSYPHLEIK